VVTGRQAPLPSAVRAVAERLATARNPVLLVGSGVDVEGGWEAAVALAERCSLPVYWAPLEHRCGFPTTHPAYQGTLPASPAGVRKALQGHDLILMVGAAAFRYYLDDPGPVLPADAELVMITSDPDQAARAPVGDAVVGDVDLALRWLVAGVPASLRPAPPVGPTPPPPGRLDGPMPPEAIYSALAQALPAHAVLVTESPSTMRTCQDYLRFGRPGSFYSPAGASLGFGLPAAVGVQLGQPQRPVVAVIGDGALQYSAPALWTAVRHRVPVTVIVLANGEYGVLKELGDKFGLTNLPGLDLPGLDNLALARAYGIGAQRVTGPAELADALREAFSSGGPNMIEVPMAGQSAPLW
jgi:benzoylformate decarboxylase